MSLRSIGCAGSPSLCRQPARQRAQQRQLASARNISQTGSLLCFNPSDVDPCGRLHSSRLTCRAGAGQSCAYEASQGRTSSTGLDASKMVLLICLQKLLAFQATTKGTVLKLQQVVKAFQASMQRQTQGLICAQHPLLGTLLAAAALPFGPVKAYADLRSNHVFMVGFVGWAIAQSLKLFTKWYKKGVWNWFAVVDSGGMPSSHSALCAGVTTAIAMEYGLASPLFAVCFCFSIIVMYDAAGVRRHAGHQAEVLNIVLEDVMRGHPISDTKLKEVLGHTPLQVVVGALLGMLVGFVMPCVPKPAITVA